MMAGPAVNGLWFLAHTVDGCEICFAPPKEPGIYRGIMNPGLGTGFRPSTVWVCLLEVHSLATQGQRENIMPPPVNEL